MLKEHAFNILRVALFWTGYVMHSLLLLFFTRLSATGREGLVALQTFQYARGR